MLPDLVDAGFAAIELLDSTSLRVAQRDPKATADLLRLDVDRHAALLVEFQETTAESLADRLAGVVALLDRLPLVTPAALSTDATRRGQLWHIRKGLYTLVAEARPPGTTALLEDVAVPIDRLDATCAGLSRLFTEFGYDDGVIFGHAKDGNIHFMINERFTSVDRYARFTEELVDLVLGQGGTLKAEHGTGRMMAPFVRRQYGDELYSIMQDLKQLVDPRGILNPGVLITADPRAHLHDLKTTPVVEEEVDRCVECGYCEPACPSRDLTMTPRQRIVLRREMRRAEANGDHALVTELQEQFRYAGVETCAVDGMCQTVCPVGIDTGDLVRRLRTESQPALAQAAGTAAARHWGAVTRVAATALTIADRLPAAVPRTATRWGRRVLGTDLVPEYSADLPAGGRPRQIADQPKAAGATPAAIYFSSCTTTMFGPASAAGAELGAAESFRRLCDRAGVPVAVPDGLPSLCCGTPWKSKGLSAGYREMSARVVTALRAATRDGAIPVVCDASSCTEGLGTLLAETGVTVVDSVVFTAEHLLPHLVVQQRMASLTLHPTCSSARLGIDAALRTVGAAIAETVVVPDDWGCCAFAGDRGMLHPEFTAAASSREAAEVRSRPTTGYASLNRTCEIGMSRAAGVPYRHVLEYLERATRDDG
ncbi:FAD-binding and (Fe-S)-binding domain-containing protein [Actinoplanes derwentensis]|uniref:FAD-binding and (Fe-S)-binding domain-containing protein n=1 Tax=Actinoplanes derwentensis TaxID=113562 RepID=UPI001A42D083|nr:FAD-linked oxidase C-terminal domain-containing protein [Actinoplanes derwentensis]GID89669.1 hypothetical protein Ade03nite_85930 [Actinoplanes derwentensis]